ncbi:nitric oxide synthase oxygenase [Paenibacillus tarimensis]
MKHEQLQEEAERFIKACYDELSKPASETVSRLEQIRTSIAERGTYEHTAEELQHGARMAWRNSNRCIGRLFWETLYLMDARSAETEDEIAEHLFRHIEYATNGGRIRPVITIFRESSGLDSRIRIWNHQLIRYAGYVTGDGIVGDPASVELTKRCLEMGWRGKGTAFDVLPLLLQIGNRPPQLFPVPDRLVLEVPIVHPELADFGTLNLKWYAVPIISDMRLEIGGLHYSAAPFNGWYMGTEIGARNLADENRYNRLPVVADFMGLDRTRESSLWRDKALVELNAAVLHSFKERGVSIVDHHTAAQQFIRFEERENKLGREVTGRWSWLIPPVSPAVTPVFHRSYQDKVITPNFFSQDGKLPDPAACCPNQPSGIGKTSVF